mmetsp:Transcript_11755/g.17725  ORF Transcript_11755/g.17725 Transcript_11755/m.17725 type:complete len:144 (+) Transcript_11755:42-473(+)
MLQRPRVKTGGFKTAHLPTGQRRRATTPKSKLVRSEVCVVRWSRFAFLGWHRKQCSWQPTQVRLFDQALEPSELVGEDFRPDLGHHVAHEVEVVRREQGGRDGLLRADQVVQIRPRVVPAGRATARRVDGLVEAPRVLGLAKV